MIPILLALLIGMTMAVTGCRAKYREDLDYSHDVLQTWPIDESDRGNIVQFESVTFAPDDTQRLRQLIREDQIAANRDVLDIRTGTGLLAILCAQNGARQVIATDTQSAAVANARYNAALLQSDQDLEVRLAEPATELWAGVQPGERFDLILINASANPDAALSESAIEEFLDRLPDYNSAGGRTIVVVPQRKAMVRWESAARQREFEVQVLDDPQIDTDRADSAAGRLLQIRVPAPESTASRAETDSP